MRYLGLDIGSRTVKSVLYEDQKPVFMNSSNTAAFYREYCTVSNEGLEVDFDRLGIAGYGGFDKVCSTGYGKNNVRLKGAAAITELKAHALGAVLQTGLKDFTLLDAGGQDSKVISVKNGMMSDMVLNDKCAASCGRYLENMAAVLGMELEQLSRYYDSPAELDSTCAVFGESELIGAISEGIAAERLAAGVNYSLFKRIRPLIERFPGETLVVAGGVALNEAFIYFLRNGLSFKEVIVPASPQYNGAIGCCAWLAGFGPKYLEYLEIWDMDD